MPISFLSAGYQSILWMVMDIAYRGALLNPDASEGPSQIEGIVLIDELDMHLHPSWQWNVITALEETFPQSSVYHSNSLPDCNLILQT